MSFDLDKWISELREAIDSYVSLHDPIFCGNAMTKYYENSILIKCMALGTVVQEKENTGKELSKKELQAVADKYTKDFSEQAFNGLMVYRRQMVVIASTIFEALLNDYLKCYFDSYPQKMYSYVGVNGTINYRDVLDYDSKQELINHYSFVASKRFTSKPWKSVLKNMEKLLKLQVNKKECILKMLSIRNEIIHEAPKVSIENDDVFYYFNAVEDFVTSLPAITET